jgi:MFS family permease
MLGSVLLLTGAWLYGESRAGLAVTPGALAASAAAMLAGRITGRYGGPRNATLFGLLAFLAGGVWMVAGLTADAAYLTLVLPVSAVTGFGMGAISYGTAMAAAMSAPPIRFAGASGMNTMARQVGGALGVAALAVILDANTGHGVSGYRDVFLFCTVLVVVALVVTWVGMRLAAPVDVS